MTKESFEEIQKMCMARRITGLAKYGEDTYKRKDMPKESIEEYVDAINYLMFHIEKLKMEANPELNEVIDDYGEIIKDNFETIHKIKDLEKRTLFLSSLTGDSD